MDVAFVWPSGVVCAVGFGESGLMSWVPQAIGGRMDGRSPRSPRIEELDQGTHPATCRTSCMAITGACPMPVAMPARCTTLWNEAQALKAFCELTGSPSSQVTEISCGLT